MKQMLETIEAVHTHAEYFLENKKFNQTACLSFRASFIFDAINFIDSG